MNKQLINKYKHEFDHWLNEGKVLHKHTNSNSWCIYEPWDYSPDYVTAIIINDEYSIYRKALVEGKTVQANINYWSFPETEEFNWQDIASPDSFNKFNLLNLRIKPNEPKFKVGDFVRVAPKSNRAITNSGTTEFTGIIRVIDKHNLYNIKGIYDTDWFESDDIQPWTPVKGEWCWFYGSKSSKSAALVQFKEMHNNYFMSTTDSPWQFCEPFLNSLPSYLKDK